jgi:hypothetical protein
MDIELNWLNTVVRLDQIRKIDMSRAWGDEKCIQNICWGN